MENKYKTSKDTTKRNQKIKRSNFLLQSDPELSRNRCEI
jgi:hypothetical protein